MWLIATDDPVAWCGCVCLSVTRLRCAKSAEKIEVLKDKDSKEPKTHCIR